MKLHLRPRRIITTLTRIYVLLAAVVALAIPGAPLHAAAPAAHTNAVGLAQVRYIFHGLAVQPPNGRFGPGKLRQPLFDRYFLRTQTGQKASVSFQDGTTLKINQDTDLVLHSHVAELRRGEAAEYLAPGTDHRIQTATAVAAAIGTVFDVRFQNRKTTLVVLHGALQVTNAGRQVVV